MRIGIDGRLSGSRHAGIGRYVENLLKNIPERAPDIDWVFFYADEGQLQFADNIPNVSLIHAPIKHYSLAEQLHMGPIVNRAHLDLLHVPHFNAPLRINCPMVITIHDLLWHEFRGSQVTTLPSWLYWPKYLGYRFVTGQAVHRAKAIIVPAETVKQTVISHYPGTDTKITVTKEGVDPQFKLAPKRSSTPEKLIVYLGSLYPHKNIQVVLQALRHLPEYSLTIVGARNVFQEQVRQKVAALGVESQVTFAGYLSDSDVGQLLSRATALVQPSLSEGFGLTGVEAMAAGVPVLASDIPIFREIYQDAAAFFDPHDPESFITHLKELERPPVRNNLIKTGSLVSKQYRWEAMADQTIALYRTVLAAHA